MIFVKPWTDLYVCMACTRFMWCNEMCGPLGDWHTAACLDGMVGDDVSCAACLFDGSDVLSIWRQ